MGHVDNLELWLSILIIIVICGDKKATSSTVIDFLNVSHEVMDLRTYKYLTYPFESYEGIDS